MSRTGTHVDNDILGAEQHENLMFFLPARLLPSFCVCDSKPASFTMLSKQSFRPLSTKSNGKGGKSMLITRHSNDCAINWGSRGLFCGACAKMHYFKSFRATSLGWLACTTISFWREKAA
jgi:hypothetical protein